jgi:hypothetical protein
VKMAPACIKTNLKRSFHVLGARKDPVVVAMAMAAAKANTKTVNTSVTTSVVVIEVRR